MKLLAAYTPAHIPPSGEVVPFVNLSIGNNQAFVHLTARDKEGKIIHVSIPAEVARSFLVSAIEAFPHG